MPRKLDLRQIRDIEAALKKLPPVQKFTVTEALLKLSGTIRELQGKGYEVKEIAGYLTDEGLPVSARLIRKVLAESRKADGTVRPEEIPEEIKDAGRADESGQGDQPEARPFPEPPTDGNPGDSDELSSPLTAVRKSEK